MDCSDELPCCALDVFRNGNHLSPRLGKLLVAAYRPGCFTLTMRVCTGGGANCRLVKPVLDNYATYRDNPHNFAAHGMWLGRKPYARVKKLEEAKRPKAQTGAWISMHIVRPHIACGGHASWMGGTRLRGPQNGGRQSATAVQENRAGPGCRQDGMSGVLKLVADDETGETQATDRLARLAELLANAGCTPPGAKWFLVRMPVYVDNQPR